MVYPGFQLRQESEPNQTLSKKMPLEEVALVAGTYQNLSNLDIV